MTSDERVFGNPLRLLLSVVLANYSGKDEPIIQRTTTLLVVALTARQMQLICKDRSNEAVMHLGAQ